MIQEEKADLFDINFIESDSQLYMTPSLTYSLRNIHFNFFPLVATKIKAQLLGFDYTF
jgi:hypothetical protein